MSLFPGSLGSSNGSARASLLAITNSMADPQNVLANVGRISALRTPSVGIFSSQPAIPYACGLLG